MSPGLRGGGKKGGEESFGSKGREENTVNLRKNFRRGEEGRKGERDLIVV